MACGFGAIDNFNDGTDDGWTHYNPINTGSWSFPNGAYRIQSAPSPIPTQLGPARAGSMRTSEDYSLFYTAVDVVTWDNTLNEVFGLSARVRESNPGAGTTDGYAFVYYTRGAGNGEVRLLRIDNEDVTSLGAAALPLLPDQVYRFVFTGVGAQLNGQVFAATNLTVPLATVTASDNFYATGTVGVFVYDNSSGSAGRADVTFDNYQSNELTPTLTIEKDSSSTDMRLSWPSWAANYRLERSEVIPGTPQDWENLGSDFQQIGDSIVTFDDSSRAQAFYRLAKP
jgi:hypothetical protein